MTLSILFLAVLAAPLGSREPAQDLGQDPGQRFEQLPEVPAGWGFERIEFPLDFAPQIEWEGFEELAFAPGMFTEGAPDNWSYALALKVKAADGTALEPTAELLDGFLERYYRGLAGAVGESPEIDPASIRAQVRGGGARFTATVETVDTFVTQEPIVLNFELLAHPDPGGGEWVELFGMASPAEPPDSSGPSGSGAAIWKQLRELGAAWQAARPVPVFLNHVYIVPDPATYAALRDSEFLRAFAVVEERTTVRGDLSYTGLYLYGDRTYFEFLRPDPAVGLAPGSTGVAFGVEQPGGLARVAAALKAAGVNTFPGQKTREFEGREVPWFELLGIEGATTTQRLQLFAMEYDPSFLERWQPADDGLAGRVDRGAVLGRYRAVVGGGESVFKDIGWVTLELDSPESARFLEVAGALEMSSPHDDSFYVDPPFPEARMSSGGVHYLASAKRLAPGGVLRFQGSLNKPLASERHQFGQVQLHIDGDRFTLAFEGLQPEESK